MRLVIVFTSVLVAVSLMTASAQEDWGWGEFVWVDGMGQPLEPCFTLDPNVVLYTMFTDTFENWRIIQTVERDLFLPESLSVDGFNDVSPYMTYDGERLYFSSNRPSGYGGYDLWRTEKADDVWMMPVNLGPMINTELDEGGPSLTADRGKLYFCRGSYDQWHSVWGDLYRSDFVGGEWIEADSLTVPIYSEFENSSPSISSFGDKLYFVSNRPSGLEDDNAVWVSYQQEDGWSDPTLLVGFVNHYWTDCDWFLVGHPLSVKVDNTGTRLLYEKLEIFQCIDGESNIYISHLQTDIDDAEIGLPIHFSLSLYPNPFNSSTTIEYNLPEAGLVTIDIYDILGRKVETLVNKEQPAGFHQVIWDAMDHSSGIYFNRIQAGDFTLTKKMLLLK